MTHRELASIVSFLVNPEILKADKRAFAREIKILRDRICKDGRYDSKQFFLSLSYPAYFPSLALFVKGEMAQDLETRWRYYQMSLIQQRESDSRRNSQNSLDTESNSQSIAGMNGEEVAQLTRKRETTLGWIDSPTPIP